VNVSTQSRFMMKLEKSIGVSRSSLKEEHIIPKFNRAKKLLYKINELRAISGHMLGATGVQVPEDDLDNLHVRIKEGTLELEDPQELLGSNLLGTFLLAALSFLVYTIVTAGLSMLVTIGMGSLGGTIVGVIILVKGQTFPTSFNVRPVGFHETEAAKSVHLRARVFASEVTEKKHASKIDALKQKNLALENEKGSLDGKVVELQSLVSTKDLELKELNTVVSSLRSQKDGLVSQVHELEVTCSSLRERLSGYENFTDRLEEFQDAQLKVVNDKVAKLDADLAEMACHLEEKFYPHLLTTISRQRWLLTHGLKLVLVKCLNSSEYLTALRSAISRSIKKVMQDGLAGEIAHGKEGRSLTNVDAYNPSAKADFNSALQELCELDYPLLAELKSHKDTSVEDIMNLLRLEGPLADAPGMGDLQPDIEQLKVPIHRSEDQVVLRETSLSFSHSVSHSRVELIRANIAAECTSASVPAATTMTLSTTFASASSISLITVDDYEIVHADGQECPQGNVQEDAAMVEIEEDLDTTLKRDFLS
nr:hypothetical protein [Tanacetum cinerariifolium]